MKIYSSLTQLTCSLLFVISLTFMPSLHSSDSSKPFEGAWRLISGEYIDKNENRILYSSEKFKSIKVISGNHFSFTTISKDGFWAAGTGRFTYSPTQYTEFPIYSSFTTGNDISFSFQYTFIEDDWKIMRYEDDKPVEIEIWRRISE